MAHFSGDARLRAMFEQDAWDPFRPMAAMWLSVPVGQVGACLQRGPGGVRAISVGPVGCVRAAWAWWGACAQHGPGGVRARSVGLVGCVPAAWARWGACA